MDIRKIQMTGGSSYVLSLPKTWVRDLGIKKNDPIGVVSRADGTLLITPNIHYDSTAKIKEFALKNYPDPETLLRSLIGAYISGFTIIKITSPGRIPPKVRQAVRRFTQMTIGQEVADEADNVIVFDNSAWKNDGESVKSAYERLNDEIVRRFGVLFRAGEIGKYGVGEMVVDSSEIINTLRGGGISSIGYAISEAVPRGAQKQRSGGLFHKKERAEPHVDITSSDDKSAKIIGMVRRAMLGRLTLPCDYSTAERALVLVAGPPTELDRKGVEKSKSWVEENIAGVEVRGGDYPVESSYVAAVVLLATIGNAPRIRELMELAKEAKEEVVKSRERAAAPSMFEDSDVDPLFE